jgi:hypothetical protein
MFVASKSCVVRQPGFFYFSIYDNGSLRSLVLHDVGFQFVLSDLEQSGFLEIDGNSSGVNHVPEIKPEYKIEGADLSMEGDIETEGDPDRVALAIVLNHDAPDPYVTTVRGQLDDPTREVTIAPVDLTMIGSAEAAGSFTGGGGFESVELAGTWQGGGSSTMTVPLDAEITGALDFKIPGAHIPVDLRLHGYTKGELYRDSEGYNDQFHMKDRGTLRSTKGHYDPPKVEVTVPPFDVTSEFTHGALGAFKFGTLLRSHLAWVLVVPTSYIPDPSTFNVGPDARSYCIFGLVGVVELVKNRVSYHNCRSMVIPYKFSIMIVNYSYMYIDVSYMFNVRCVGIPH